MMIEADVSMGTIKGKDENLLLVPIMAHPPSKQSDLSLEEFLDTILDYHTPKGIKLDFKSIEVVESALEIVKLKIDKVWEFYNSTVKKYYTIFSINPKDQGTFVVKRGYYFRWVFFIIQFHACILTNVYNRTSQCNYSTRRCQTIFEFNKMLFSRRNLECRLDYQV